MTEKRSSGFKDRRGGGGGSYRGSSGYHPYHSKGHSNFGNNSRRSSNSSSNSSLSTRYIIVDEAIKTDRILSIENFANVERIKDQDLVPAEYSKYIKKHQKTHLWDTYSRHKNEKWIINLINNTENNSFNNESFFSQEWTSEFNLEYLDSFEMKIEETSNEIDSLINNETRLFPYESMESIPSSFSKFLPNFVTEIITISNIPPHVNKEALESHLKDLARNSEIQITYPNADKSFYRLAWLNLPDSSTNSVTEIVSKLESLGSIEGSKVYFGISSSNFRRFKVTNYIENSEEELLNLAIKLIRSFEEHFDDSCLLTESISQSLDKAVLYLRSVHNFCFYCANKFSCPQEMLAKCGDLHLRRPCKNESVNHDQHRLIEKLSALIIFIDCLTENSKDLSFNLDEILSNSSVKKVEEGKFRCNHCAKAFKGPEFVLKHLSLKHEDVIKQTEDQIAEFNKLLSNAPLWLFPSSMIPRYTKIRSKFLNNFSHNNSRDSQDTSKSSNSKNSRREYKDLDAIVTDNFSNEINYDL